MDWEQEVQWYRPMFYDLERAHVAGEGNHARSGYCIVCFRMQRALVRALMLHMPLDRVSLDGWGILVDPLPR